MSLRDRLLRFMRVPPRPHLPADDPALVRTFNAAPQYLTYKRLSWALKQAAALAGLIAGLIFLRAVPAVASGRVHLGPWRVPDWFLYNGFLVFEVFAWAGFIIQAVGSFLLLRLDWEQRWYLISDRSLRVREGIVRLHEKTTTFANIQNVSIRQGPLQRWFGIADVQVKSAGGGGGSKDGDGSDDLHTVSLRGLADAARVRDTILDRARHGAGPDAETASPAPGPARPGQELAAAARELLAESRTLGHRLVPGGR